MRMPKVYFNNHTAKWNYERQNNDDTEYIRADIAELTWEDIEKIVDLYEDVYSDYSCNGNGGITNTAEHYQEVLQRFLESKKDKI